MSFARNCLALWLAMPVAGFVPQPLAADTKKPSGEASTAPVQLTDKNGIVAVQINGKPFTEYRYQAEPDLPYSKPYFFPVRAADGTEITSDQARHSKEHPHHRSIWVGQGAVNGFDHWAHAKDPAKQPMQKHLGFEKISGDTLVETLAWTDADGKAMLNETRTWRFFADADGNPGMDLKSVYTAVDKPVTFGSTKEGGMISARVNKSISDKCVITLSSGATSSQNADKAKKVKGDEANVWGKAAEWCDISGPINGKTYGIVVFDHPSNPRHPGNWHVRRYGLLGANIFGLHDFDKAKYPEETAGELKVEPGTPVTFQYRLIVHSGDAAAAKLKEKFAGYR